MKPLRARARSWARARRHVLAPGRSLAWLVLSLLAAVLLLISACGDDGDYASGNPQVISAIPWTASETAKYRILRDDDVVGSGVLQIEQQGGSLTLSQNFSATEEKITDEVTAIADAKTLSPRSVSRVIDGPEGERVCDARYAGAKVSVEQRSEEDERTDELDLPPNAYDTWVDLFLWRTIDFRQDFHATYNGVLTCALVKPDVIETSVAVKERETVEVPAGTFETWRLEIRSGGDTTNAWYAVDKRHTLVRYDNGRHVFELDSIE